MTTERKRIGHESTAVRPLVADDVWVRHGQGPIPGSRQIQIVVTCAGCQESRRYRRRSVEGRPSVGVAVGYVRHLNQLGWRAVPGTGQVICPKHSVDAESAPVPGIRSETLPGPSVEPQPTGPVPVNRRLEEIGRGDRRIPVVTPRPLHRRPRPRGPCINSGHSR
jgi:hypothetical protein